jgi:hypothetical protein
VKPFQGSKFFSNHQPRAALRLPWPMEFNRFAVEIIQRRAKPWYIGRTACYILLSLVVFGPTGQEFA